MLFAVFDLQLLQLQFPFIFLFPAHPQASLIRRRRRTRPSEPHLLRQASASGSLYLSVSCSSSGESYPPQAEDSPQRAAFIQEFRHILLPEPEERKGPKEPQSTRRNPRFSVYCFTLVGGLRFAVCGLTDVAFFVL